MKTERERLKLGELFGACLGTRDAKWLLLVVVKVGGVTRTTAFWKEWSFDLEKCEDEIIVWDFEYASALLLHFYNAYVQFLDSQHIKFKRKC